MIEKIVERYINNMSKDSLIALAQRKNIIFKDEEAEIVLPFIKYYYKDFLDPFKRKTIKEKLSTELSSDTFAKLEYLLLTFIPE